MTNKVDMYVSFHGPGRFSFTIIRLPRVTSNGVARHRGGKLSPPPSPRKISFSPHRETDENRDYVN